MAGFKVFTRETLSSADVNGYLMGQAVLVFASSAARAAAVAAPTAGMTSYLLDRKQLETYDSASGLWLAPPALGEMAAGAMTTDGTVMTTTTRTRQTGGLNISAVLVPGRIYRAELTGAHGINATAGGQVEATLSVVAATATPAVGDTVVAAAQASPFTTGTAGVLPMPLVGEFTVGTLQEYQVNPWVRRSAGTGNVQLVLGGSPRMVLSVRDVGSNTLRGQRQVLNPATHLAIP